MTASPLTHVRGGMLGFCIVAAGTLAVPPAEGQSNKSEKKEDVQRAVSGIDPQSFADAWSMYSPSGGRPIDDVQAGDLIRDLKRSASGAGLWTPDFVKQLDRLREVRVSPSMAAGVRSAARATAVRERAVSREKLATAGTSFREGNSRYEQGEFGQAAAAYRSCLQTHPAHWDAWNNLALAEIHAGNDLVALYLLSALQRNNPSYAGAAVNLAVCLERLGASAEAEDAASSVAASHPQLVQSQYNMAWFANARGQYGPALEYLARALAVDSSYRAAKRLRTLTAMESGTAVKRSDLEACPPAEQSQGVPNIVTRAVTAQSAAAYDADTLVTSLPKGTVVVISERSGDRCAVYWLVKGEKRRLWVRAGDLEGER